MFFAFKICTLIKHSVKRYFEFRDHLSTQGASRWIGVSEWIGTAWTPAAAPPARTPSCQWGPCWHPVAGRPHVSHGSCGCWRGTRDLSGTKDNRKWKIIKYQTKNKKRGHFCLSLLVSLTNERVGHVVPLGGNPKLEVFYISLSKKAKQN